MVYLSIDIYIYIYIVDALVGFVLPVILYIYLSIDAYFGCSYWLCFARYLVHLLSVDIHVQIWMQMMYSLLMLRVLLDVCVCCVCVHVNTYVGVSLQDHTCMYKEHKLVWVYVYM